MELQFTQEQIDNGYILVDSEFGKQIGFTSDKFSKNSYLVKDDNLRMITLSLIESLHEHKGNVLALLQNIDKKKYSMISYSVINKRLANILNKFGFCITTDLNFIYLQDYYVISSIEKEMQKIIKTLAVIQAKQTTGELKTRIKRITDHLQQTQQEFTEVENILKSEKE